jgi:hypothetical protein
LTPCNGFFETSGYAVLICRFAVVKKAVAGRLRDLRAIGALGNTAD